MLHGSRAGCEHVICSVEARAGAMALQGSPLPTPDAAPEEGDRLAEAIRGIQEQLVVLNSRESAKGG
mgnify:CR=1 FL=1